MERTSRPRNMPPIIASSDLLDGSTRHPKVSRKSSVADSLHDLLLHPNNDLGRELNASMRIPKRVPELSSHISQVRSLVPETQMVRPDARGIVADKMADDHVRGEGSIVVEFVSYSRSALLPPIVIVENPVSPTKIQYRSNPKPASCCVSFAQVNVRPKPLISGKLLHAAFNHAASITTLGSMRNA